MRWTSLERLPLDAYLAPMGLYTLLRGFDETFERVQTPRVNQYRTAIADCSVGELGSVHAEA